MAWAVEQKTGSASTKAVLLALANRANHDTGLCCPSMARIASELELSVRTVERATTALVEQGLIGRVRQRRDDGTLGVYSYSFPACSPPDMVTGSPPDTVSGRNRKNPGSGSIEPSPGAQVRAKDEIWDALVLVCGQVTNSNTRGKRNRVVKLLRESQATAPEIEWRAKRYRHLYPDLPLTDTALANQWDNLAPPPRRRPTVCADCEVGGGYHAIDCPQAGKVTEMIDPTRDSSDRNNAYRAARDGTCPSCENNIIVADWGDNPDGTARLLHVHCNVCDYRWPRKKDIYVTVHAVERYRQRVNREGAPSDVPHGPDAVQIAGLVRAAIEAGRVQNHKTARYKLWRETNRQLPDGQRFVWTEDESFAWIIKRDGEQWVVVTTLTPTIAAIEQEDVA
jgi:hypothetical protein